VILQYVPENDGISRLVLSNGLGRDPNLRHIHLALCNWCRLGVFHIRLNNPWPPMKGMPTRP